MEDDVKTIDQVEITEEEGKSLFTEEPEKKEEPEDKTDKDDSGDESEEEPEKNKGKKPDAKPEDESDDDSEGDADENSDEGSDEGSDEDAEKIVIDDHEYTQDEIREAIQGNMRQHDYTRKMQELSEQRKSIDRISGVIQKLTADKDAVARVIEAIEDEYGEDVAKEFQDALTSDPGESPYKNELETAHTERDYAVAELELFKESIALQRKYHLKDAEVQSVIDYATKEFEESKGTKVLSLEDAYRLMNFDAVRKTATTKKKEKPPVPNLANKKKGVRSIETQTPKSFDEITEKDFEEANLFD